MASVVGIVLMVFFAGIGNRSIAPERVARPVTTRSPARSYRKREQAPSSNAFVSNVNRTVTAIAPKPAPLHRLVVGNRPLRILVVGDSVGSSFAKGLDSWARTTGEAQVLNDARSWCALGRGALISQGFTSQAPNTGCSGWATRWAASVQSFDPDVVFVLFTIWEISPRQLPGRTDWLQPGASPLDAWQLSEYRSGADVLSARGAAVDWFTIPCEHELIATGTPLWYVNRKTIPALAASRKSVHVIDLDHEMCHGGAGNDYGGVSNARPDGAHFSVAGAAAVAKWVMPFVFGAAPNPVTYGELDTAVPQGATRRAS